MLSIVLYSAYKSIMFLPLYAVFHKFFAYLWANELKFFQSKRILLNRNPPTAICLYVKSRVVISSTSLIYFFLNLSLFLFCRLRGKVFLFVSYVAAVKKDKKLQLLTEECYLSPYIPKVFNTWRGFIIDKFLPHM